MVFFVLTLFFITGTGATTCPPGVPIASCKADPCTVSTCPRYPGAICRSNYCGGCNAVYYEKVTGLEVNCDIKDNTPCKPGVSPLPGINCGRGGTRCPGGYYCDIHPTDRYAVCCPRKGETTCPPGVPIVNCFADPCSVSTCPRYPSATCRSNYCGGCNAVYYDEVAGLEVNCKIEENCPVPPSPFLLRCPLIDKCATDHSCPGRQKCCKHPCGKTCRRPVRVKPGTCPPFVVASIRDCAPGTINDRCYRDGDCPGTQKCCQGPCGNKCRGPTLVERKGTCPTFIDPYTTHCDDDRKGNCFQDGDCPGRQKCCRHPCGSQCRDAIEHTGTCPPIPPNIAVQCPDMLIDECKNDLQCDVSGICCRGICGDLVCVSPVKPGTCPVRPPYNCPRIDICTDDGNCLGTDKCCEDRCGKNCTTPVTDKPGICPLPHPNVRFRCSDVRARCKDDRECRGSRKCCYHPCGKRCSRTVTEKEGTCSVDPAIPSPGPTICPPVDLCRKDKHCPGADNKCCDQHCGKRCIKGTCPPFHTGPYLCNQKSNHCRQDHHCPGSLKCCRRPCGYRCVPTAEHGGTCPRFSQLVRCPKTYPQLECDGVGDCDDHEKCCERPCGDVTCIRQGCYVDGRHFNVGDKVSGGPCNPCKCGSNGKISCYAIDCAVSECVDPVRNPDQCCSSCRNGPNCRLPDGSIMSATKPITLPDGRVCTCITTGGGYDASCK